MRYLNRLRWNCVTGCLHLCTQQGLVWAGNTNDLPAQDAVASQLLCQCKLVQVAIVAVGLGAGGHEECGGYHQGRQQGRMRGR